MKNINFQSLTSQLSLWIIASCTLITVAILSTNYFLSRHLLENYIERLARKTVSSTIKDIDTVLQSAATSADSLAAVIGSTVATSDSMTEASPEATKTIIRETITAFVTNNNEIFGMAVALKPQTLLTASSEFAPYYYKNNDRKNNDGITYKDLAKSYRYQSKSWYNDVEQSGIATWSEPYDDEGGGNAHMVTYSSPIYMANGQTFAGVATADIRLSWLDKVIKNSKISNSGHAFIVSGKDLIIAHPDKSLHMKPLKEITVSQDNWAKYLASKTSLEAAYFSTPCHYQKGDCWIAIKTLAVKTMASNNWKVIAVIPEDELISDVTQLTITIAVLGFFGLLFTLLIIIFITRKLISPLKQLAIASKEIGSGNLDARIPGAVHNDEIGTLTKAFHAMRASLKEYVAELKETTIKKQKLESEMQIATDIQMSMIPGSGKVFIKNKNHQLFAFLKPARSVGGDLYYYQQADDILHFIIGDVSDKGVPAALFMAKTVTLYTRALRDKLSPGQTFNMMNNILVQDNDACMFVTALCGAIDLQTGCITMSNAGHINPIIKDQINTRIHEINGATALGLMDNVNYPDLEFQLDHQSSIVMYTDGISEARDAHDNQYSDEKLLELLAHDDNQTNINNPEYLGKTIIKSVNDFADSTEQFDDITLLIIRYE